MSRARLLAAALLGVIATFALLLGFAGVRADTPLRPALVREWPLAFTSSTQAQLINEPSGLKVIGHPGEGMVMISAELAPFAASELRFLDIERSYFTVPTRDHTTSMIHHSLKTNSTNRQEDLFDLNFGYFFGFP